MENLYANTEEQGMAAQTEPPYPRLVTEAELEALRTLLAYLPRL